MRSINVTSNNKLIRKQSRAFDSQETLYQRGLSIIASGADLDASIQCFRRLEEVDASFCPEVNSTVAESLNSEAVGLV